MNEVWVVEWQALDFDAYLIGEKDAKMFCRRFFSSKEKADIFAEKVRDAYTTLTGLSLKIIYVHKHELDLT